MGMEVVVTEKATDLLRARLFKWRSPVELVSYLPLP
jgi:hypothetical protein